MAGSNVNVGGGTLSCSELSASLAGMLQLLAAGDADADNDGGGGCGVTDDKDAAKESALP